MSTVEWLEIIFRGGNLNEKSFVVAKEIEKSQHSATWNAATKAIDTDKKFEDYYGVKFQQESNF